MAPSLRPGQVVVTDNLSAHKGGRVREILRAAGCEPLYLPPYSPDLNPVEQPSRRSRGSSSAPARTREALIGALGRALDAVSARDARGSYTHCGYRSVGQPL